MVCTISNGGKQVHGKGESYGDSESDIKVSLLKAYKIIQSLARRGSPNDTRLSGYLYRFRVSYYTV